MPNHITTEVEISGSAAKIAKLIKDTKLKLDTDIEINEFDFNGIVPMPKELKDTVSPPQIVQTDTEASKINAEYAAEKRKFPGGDQRIRAISKAEQQRRIKEYGAITWYEFANNQWGTKWNAYEVRYLQGDKEKIVLTLQTAWDTPRAIWQKLEELGYTVKDVIYGEMEGYDFIGAGNEVFEAYQNVEVEYVG